MKRALVVGATGQDGTLLSARLLRERDVEWIGINTRGIMYEGGRRAGVLNLGDAKAVTEFVAAQQPTHVFYLAAHHHSSQDKLDSGQAELWRRSLEVQVHGLVNFLEALRLHSPGARLFYASSSHIFGSPTEVPQRESTTHAPANVYAVTKVAGMNACRYYREQHGQFASVGILYNHESLLRSPKFLTRKIVDGAVAIKQGRAQKLILGDLSAEVDWGYAPDYVEAMSRILEADQPGDFIVATGQLHTVREFAELAFAELELDWSKHVEEDPALIRPQRSRLVGDATHLRTVTGWKPSVSFAEMVRLLTREALAANKTL
jgi:GDPmannose 4,6-dehydratase